jgi:hypothetical protein
MPSDPAWRAEPFRSLATPRPRLGATGESGIQAGDGWEECPVPDAWEFIRPTKIKTPLILFYYSGAR